MPSVNSSANYLANLKLNIVPNNATFSQMVTNNQINSDEFYFVEGDDGFHVNTGAANRVAYYSASEAIDSSSIYTDGSKMTIGGTTAPTDGIFQVKGSSVFQSIYPESTGTYFIGSTSQRWSNGFFSGLNISSSSSFSNPFLGASGIRIDTDGIHLVNDAPYIKFHAGLNQADFTSSITAINVDELQISSNKVRFRNKNNDNNAATTDLPYISQINIGDGDYITLSEYRDNSLRIRGSSLLLSANRTIQKYSNSDTYSLNSIVWYNRNYYRCTTAITTAEEWNSAHWTSMPTAGIMSDGNFNPWITNTYTLGNSSYRWSAVYIGTANSYGSTTQPIYWSNGVPTQGSQYAGGTAITLNGTFKSSSTASFYAPTRSGTANTQALVSDGENAAPKWVNISPSITITAGTGSAAPKVNVTVLGQSGTAQSITSATTSVYGVTKLSSTSSTSEAALAATPAGVWDAINTALSGTQDALAYYSTASSIASTLASNGGVKYLNETFTLNNTQLSRFGLFIYGPTYGNNEDYLLGSKGILRYNDGGPRIRFSDNAQSPQYGEIIYSVHDSVSPGVSWNFVSDQTDWNVISKRFHARSGISIGECSPATTSNGGEDLAKSSMDGLTIFRATTEFGSNPPTIYFKARNTTSNFSALSSIRAYAASSDGNNLVVTSGGNLILGGGESGENFYQNVVKNYFNTGENTFVVADNILYLLSSNDNNMWGFYVSASTGSLIPYKPDFINNNSNSSNNLQNLGSTDYKFKNLYLGSNAYVGGNAHIGSTIYLGNENTNGVMTFTHNNYPGWTDLYSPDGVLVGQYWYTYKGYTNNNYTGKYYWRQFSPASASDNTRASSAYEDYVLPTVTSGMNSSKTYQIWTTKEFNYSFTTSVPSVPNDATLYFVYVNE